MGLGYQLFEGMLKHEKKQACQLAYDHIQSWIPSWAFHFCCKFWYWWGKELILFTTWEGVIYKYSWFQEAEEVCLNLEPGDIMVLKKHLLLVVEIFTWICWKCSSVSFFPNSGNWPSSIFLPSAVMTGPPTNYWCSWPSITSYTNT